MVRQMSLFRSFNAFLLATLVLLVLVHLSTAQSETDDPVVDTTTVPEVGPVVETPEPENVPMTAVDSSEDGETTASEDPDVEGSETPGVMTSPPGVPQIDFCINDSECPSGQFCQFDSSTSFGSGTFGKCNDKVGPGLECSGTNGCLPDLFCNFTSVSGPNDSPTCAQTVGSGTACPSFSDEECTGELKCIPDSNFQNPTCQLGTAAVGESCSTDSVCAENLFCDFSGSSSVCAEKKENGESCSGNPSECLSENCRSDPVGNGTCVAPQGIGEACTGDSDCVTTFSGPTSATPSIVCITRFTSDPFGRCFNESNLIKTLGASCDTSLDICDSRRSLTCENVEGEDVCVQKLGVGGSSLCTPNSPLSTCTGTDPQSRGSPLVCRQFNNENKTLVGSFECRVPLQEVEDGGICNNEAQICGEGVKCANPQGVTTSLGSSQAVQYCLKEVPVGGDCSNPFETVCESGSLCINNVCALSNATLNFVGIFGSCGSGQTCAPGLECSSSAGNICSVPSTTVGSGEECTQFSSPDIAAKNCESGLICRQVDPSGPFVCAGKAASGETCNGSDEQCTDGLRCVTKDNSFSSFVCVNSSGLGIGATCTSSTEDGECGVGSSPAFGDVALQCLPKGDSLACQFVQGLFGSCGANTNNACAEGLTCDAAQSICLVSQ